MEQLVFLAEQLPELEFHAAAPTSVWQGLYGLNQKDNITVYPNISYEDFRDSLLERADIYLDINHGPELNDIITKALEQGKGVFAFDNVAHCNGYGVRVVFHQKHQEMIAQISDYLESLPK
ncbi:TPA: hypothetical protein ACG5KU_002189 [Streptococcus agalactiae]